MRNILAALFVFLVATACYAQSTNPPPTSYTSGTWTPSITTSGTVGTPAYAYQVGYYTHIGNSVKAQFSISLSSWAGSPTGNVYLNNLPFAAANVANDNGTCAFSYYLVAGLAALNYGLSAPISPGAVAAQLLSGGSATSGLVTAAQFGSAGTIIGVCFYHT